MSFTTVQVPGDGEKEKVPSKAIAYRKTLMKPTTKNQHFI